MISHNPDINCTNARSYYYDFLRKETRKSIPHGTLQHIKQCRNCQTEMDRLKDLLVKADEKFETEQSRKDSAISTLLKLHFNHLGEPIKCDTVRPFLASLADPALRIRIPTPITTHLNKCKTCRDDLQKLLALHLPHKYLCRLGQLLADEPAENNISCSKARAAIPAVVSMAFHETNAETLKHLCSCSNCRKSLYLHRENVRKELMLNGMPQDGFPCESVTAADIYDYCLPYGIDPADDEYNEFRESLTSHFRRCPTCLAKIQELHSTISDISERAESGVITVYNIDESTKTKAHSESEAYAGFPIGAEMADSKDNVHAQEPKIFDITSRLKNKATALNVKQLLKAGLAAVAVIAIGFALLFNSPAAGAVTIEQICKAIENVKNVYIASFVPNKTEPEQERWVSRSSNIYMTKTKETSVLLDITNKVQRVKHFNTDLVETSPLSSEMITETKKMMTGFLGLVPFANVPAIPNDAEWNRAGNDLVSSTEAIEIYELTWSDKTEAGVSRFNKWLFFIDSKSNLPQKIKSYRKLNFDTEYTFLTTTEIKYLSDSEMGVVVNEASF
jgi:hypothetical protein